MRQLKRTFGSKDGQTISTSAIFSIISCRTNLPARTAPLTHPVLMALMAALTARMMVRRASRIRIR